MPSEAHGRWQSGLHLGMRRMGRPARGFNLAQGENVA